MAYSVGYMVGYWGGISIILAVIFLPLYFYSRVVAKAGFSRWWIALTIVPLVNILMLWVFAYARWPAQPER